MKKIKRGIKLFLLTSIIVFGILATALAYFFIANDAPVLNGEVIHHVEYKENLTLDIYQPTQKVFDKTPVLIYYHGGAWMYGIKETLNVNRFNGAVNILREKGYAVISPNYTLAQKDKSPFPDNIIDAMDAIMWVENNANAYGFDVNNIGLLGESAGAHLAMMTAYAKPGQLLSLPNFTSNINYVIDAYGPNDLKKLYGGSMLDSAYILLEKLPGQVQEHLDISQRLFGFDPKQDELKAKEFMEIYSPINYVHPDIPPTLIIHGDSDQLVPVDQSLALWEILDSMKVDHENHTLNGVRHAFRGASEKQKSDVQLWIVDFIERHYN